MKRILLFAVLLFLLIPFVGCWATTSKNTVMDSDRALIHQNEEAAKRIQADPAVPEPTKAIAADIQANSEQLSTNFGPPKDPKVLEPYTAPASDKYRKQSDTDHKKKANVIGTVTIIGGGILALLAGVFLRGANIGSIPVAGPLINFISPRLANGAAINEKILAGAMTVIDKARDMLDRKQILTGDDLKGMVRAVMGDAGVLPQNTALYNATNTGVLDIPVAPAAPTTIVVQA